MKNWMKIFVPTAFAAIGSIALTAGAYGQFQRIPTKCIVIADEVIVNDQPFTSAGTMDLSPGESSPPDEPIQWMQLLNDGFSAQSDDPKLGTITWELDNSRTVETSNIRSNDANKLFPATVQLDFYVRATISSLPNNVFLSRTPISIGNDNIISWPPGDTELSSVDSDGDGKPDPVEFFEKSKPDEIAFIVNRLRSRVRD